MVWIYTSLGAGGGSGSPHSHLPLRNGAGSPHNWKLNMLSTEKRRADSEEQRLRGPERSGSWGQGLAGQSPKKNVACFTTQQERCTKPPNNEMTRPGILMILIR